MVTLIEIARRLCYRADATYRRFAARLLRRDQLLLGSERRFRALLESAPDAMVIVNSHGHLVLVNAQAEKLFGYDRAELIGQRIEVLIPPRLRRHPRDHVRSYLREAPARPMGGGLELFGAHRDGTEFPVEISLTPLETDAGTLVSAAIRDVTGRKAAERELQEAEERFRLAFDNAPIGMALVAPEGHWLRVNRALCEMTGYSEEQLLGRTHQEITHPDDLDADLEQVRRILAGEIRSYEIDKRYLCADGSALWTLLSVSLVRDGHGEPRYFISQIQDISERHRIEAANARARRSLVEAQAIAGMGSWDYELTGGRSGSWSPELWRICGLEPRESARQLEDLVELFDPGDRPRVLAAISGVAPGEQIEDELWITQPSGTRVRAAFRARVDRDRDGRPMHVRGTIQDITREHAARQELGHRAEQLRTLARSFPRGCIVLFDTELRYLIADGPALADFGHSPGDLEGKTVDEVYSPGTAGPLKARYRSALAGEEQRFETVLDDRRVYDSRIAPVRDHHGNVIGGSVVTTDVTERAEHEAEQTAIGHIATLVAHGAGPAAVFQDVAEQVAKLFAATCGSIIRYDRAAGVGVIVGNWTGDGDDVGGQTFALDGPSAAATVFRTGETVRIERYPEAGKDEVLRRLELEGALSAPVTVGGTLWGAVSAGFGGVPVPVGAEPRLARFAELVAVAIANAETWSTLAHQAATDPVTGLANHRAFHQRLRAEAERARRYKRPLSLVLFDLDHFKQINDTHGHQAGDEVLAETAHRIAAEAREGELVARIGGEEFAWLMPETGQEGAYAAADRARQAIQSEPFDVVGAVTISAGVCSSDYATGAEDLVRLADRALYWAKEGGRNSTFIYTEGARIAFAEAPPAPERVQTMSSVRALARAIDSKDSSTHSHSERVARLAEMLALELGWTRKRAQLLHLAGLLHDVGKIGIPDSILLKPGPLTSVEHEEIKRHASLGGYISAEVLESEQVAWIRGHHERWDGTGYPDRLAGEQLPDGAQLLALADAWDVMTESRSYKPTKTIREALSECARESGAQFAPQAITALVRLARRGGLSTHLAEIVRP